MYWTDDPSLQVWWEEGWEPKGEVGYQIDCSSWGSWRGAALYIWPTSVDYVVATTGEFSTGLYIVRVHFYASNINHNTCTASDYWSPCSGGSLLEQWTRPATGEKTWQKYTGFSIHLEGFSVNFQAVKGGSVTIGGSLSLRFKIVEYYIDLSVVMEDWSQAPPSANYLRVYACDSSNLRVRAQYEG